MKPSSEELMKALEAVKRMVNDYVEKGPYFLNPDNTVLMHVLRRLAENKVKYGFAYCPCRPVTMVPEKDKENICPCRAHRRDITIKGACECGLFVSKAYLDALKGGMKAPNPSIRRGWFRKDL